MGIPSRQATVSKMMIMYVIACVLVATTCSTTSSYSRLKIHQKGTPIAQNRMKRSLITIGATAVKALLDGAKFVFSDGLHRVFMKPGGFKQAYKDFTSANTAKTVRILPYQAQLQSIGSVGNRRLTLREDGPTRTTVLQISKIPPRGYHTNVDPVIDTMIIYTDKI